ncbi:MAG: penicillin-binding protein activator [Hyphomicrobiaceae bacterium]
MKRQHPTRRQLLGGFAGTALATTPATWLGGCASEPLETTQSLGTETAATATASAASSPAKVTLLLPRTGNIQLTMLSKGLNQAAELALFERDVPTLHLSVRDDHGTPAGATAAATTALADGAELILGPLFSSSVKAVSPLVKQANVPVIAFSNDPAVAGRDVYLLSFFNDTEARQIARHALADGRRRFAVLLPNDDLGRDSGPAFKATVTEGGGTIVAGESYAGGPTKAFGLVMDAIDSAAASGNPVDALYMPAASAQVPRLLSLLGKRRLDRAQTRLLLSSGWDQPIAAGNATLRGACMAAPDPIGWREFSSRFGQAYNTTPPRLASLVYDAVTIAATFATQAKGQRFTPANLSRPMGFSGIDGPFRFASDGRVERNLAILEFQAHGLVTLAAPAPIGGSRPAYSVRGTSFGNG